MGGHETGWCGAKLGGLCPPPPGLGLKPPLYYLQERHFLLKIFGVCHAPTFPLGYTTHAVATFAMFVI